MFLCRKVKIIIWNKQSFRGFFLVVYRKFLLFFTFLFLILTGIMVNRRYEKKNFGLLYSVGKITLKVRNSQVKLRKLAFFLKNIKTEYP